MSIVPDKNTLRTDMKQRRGALDIMHFRASSNRIIESCQSLGEYRRARTVHTYVSVLDNEVDTLGLIWAMLDAGRTVAVPRCHIGARSFENIVITSLDDLTPSRWGLMEPKDTITTLIAPEAFDVAFIPLVAFDREGNRLGLGGGFYDDFLAKARCPKIGLAHSFQEVDRVPVEPHDRPLDCIVTEKEVIRVG